MITTMFDYYGLPHDTPGIDDDCCDIYEMIEHIENLIMNDVGAGHSNLIFNLVLLERWIDKLTAWAKDDVR